MRQPAPRFILILDGTRTTNLGMLQGIQASEVFEIRVIGESQSIGKGGESSVRPSRRTPGSADGRSAPHHGSRKMFSVPPVAWLFEFPSVTAIIRSTMIGLFQCPPPQSSLVTSTPVSG